MGQKRAPRTQRERKRERKRKKGSAFSAVSAVKKAFCSTHASRLTDYSFLALRCLGLPLFLFRFIPRGRLGAPFDFTSFRSGCACACGGRLSDVRRVLVGTSRGVARRIVISWLRR